MSTHVRRASNTLEMNNTAGQKIKQKRNARKRCASEKFLISFLDFPLSGDLIIFRQLFECGKMDHFTRKVSAHFDYE